MKEMKKIQLDGQTYEVVDEKARKQIDEQNKNLQWFIDNGYLPDPNNPNIVLYDYGKINENMVADFSATGTGSVRTFKKEANYLYSTAGDASGVLLYTVKPVNLNGVKKVHFVMINSSVTNAICLNTTMPSGWPNLSKEQAIAVTSSPTDLAMDVTDYNGEYYLCVKTKSLANTKVYKIYLEY